MTIDEERASLQKLSGSAKIREISCALLIGLDGRFLLQQRDMVPHIVAPGKIGLFGGHREGEETFLDCVVREVHEETSYFVSPERFEHLGDYSADAEVPGGTTIQSYFVARDIPADVLVVTEGSLRIAARDELASLQTKLTPVTANVLDLHLGRGWRAE